MGSSLLLFLDQTPGFLSLSFYCLFQGFTLLMGGSRIGDLRRMYILFSRVSALEALRQGLSSYIRGSGQGIVMDEEKDKDLVSCLLDFKASVDAIWEEAFVRNESFANTIKDSFEHLINLRQVLLCSFYPLLNPFMRFFHLSFTCMHARHAGFLLGHQNLQTLHAR